MFETIFSNLVVILVSIVSFVVLLSLIVSVHEFGHFQVARWCGVKVDIFSLGFGKPLFRRKDRHGTEWRISMLPLGGYVKFFGDASVASNPSEEVIEEHHIEEEEHQRAENSNEEEAKPITTQFPGANEKENLHHLLSEEEKKVCFHFKPLWQKALIVAAGPFANFALALVIFWAFFWGYGIVHSKIVVGGFSENSAALEAGFEVGDEIVSVNGQSLRNFNSLRQIVTTNTGTALTFEVKRGGEQLTISATPRRGEIRDALGNVEKVGLIGISQDQSKADQFVQKIGPLRAAGESVRQLTSMISTTVRFFGRLLRGKEDVRQLGGPVDIAKYAGQAATVGFSDDVAPDVPLSARLWYSLQTFIQLAAAISVSIGFLNLLPIPVLDGGHLATYAWEALTGQPPNEAVMGAAYRIGIVLLLSLMIFVTVNDVTQLF